MAINLATRYPGRANPADSNYPQGSFKNRSAPGVLDGSYLEKDWANDMFAFFQQALVEAGISPNDDVDNATNSQYYEALKAVFAAKNDFLSITTTAFEASVTDGEAVYWDSANSRFDEAIADGTNKQNMIGFADVTNSRVVLMGAYAGQLSGLTAGAKYYLSGTVAGAITATEPISNVIIVGIAKSAIELFLDVDASGTIPDATTALKGKVLLAQSSDFTGLGSLTAVPPVAAIIAGLLGLGGSSENDYITIPYRDKADNTIKKLIVQWGKTPSTFSSNFTVTLPISFPENARFATGSKISSTDTTADLVVVSISNSQIVIRNTGSTSAAAYWLAIGH
jgi:hypothetical protein